ncbi:MAG: TetR/AcrR family transcriptional regulator [Caulobacterales bacterium]|nr:TetR/AcrR family transcriptional regulator [Caulobacterales bacterium]
MSDEPTARDSRSRDRARTEADILAAARVVLAEDGFQGFGVNAVARRAGCDKQLIYRYFGGLDGLVDAIGLDLAGWLERELLSEDAPPRTYAELVEQLVLRFLAALRADPLVQRIAIWELAAPSPLVARLAAARGTAMMRWVAKTRGALTPPEGVDAPAFNALLIAAVQQLVLAGAAVGSFSGLPLQSDADWARVQAAAVTLVRAVYSEG